MDVGAWLHGLSLGQYERAFCDNDIDARVLPGLTAEDLREIGVTSVGHRRLMLQAIAELSSAPLPPPVVGMAVEAVVPPTAHTPRQAERRQLTVMFVDLVNSTALSTRLDPEEMGEAIRAYQDACAGSIARFEGVVSEFMGDGVMAYFGFPRAHENDAERAVCVGLELIKAIGRLRAPDGTPLGVRVGIATGLVVVGELVGSGPVRERSAVGETPNLAARLQTLAEPGTVVIAHSTRQLVGGLFEYADGGTQPIKGFAEPIQVWRVLGEGRAQGRFEALHGAALTPLVGREGLLLRLLDRWRQASRGTGQVVLLGGDPGIGKSRLVRALQDHLRDDPHLHLRYQCSPLHFSSPLHPVIEQLERAADIARDDDAERRLDKLEALLALRTEKLAEVVPLIAALLSLPAEARYPPLHLTPQAQKNKTLEALVGQLEGVTRQRPLLLVFEDAHWSDPTSLELLELAIRRVRTLPILLIVTFRPEFVPPWTNGEHVTALTLNRLDVHEVRVMVERSSGAKILPGELADQIVAKSDGVPLFVEELTRTALGARLFEETAGCLTLVGPPPPLAIPATLRDSLMARLDRLQPVKVVAQAGAVLGREFSYDLLAAVSPLCEDTLRSALARLEEAGLILPRGSPLEAGYAFKHALVRDAAYETLLKSERPLLHARVVHALEERFPGTAEREPEILAHHCAEAGLVEKSAGYRLKAGRWAIARSALAEAIAQLSRGLEGLAPMPHEATRLKLELELQVALGTALAIARGWPAAEMGRTFARACELCAFLGSDAELSPALHGLAIFHLMRAEPETTRRLALEMLGLAKKRDDAGLEIAARQVLGSAFHVSSRFADARSQYERLLELYDPERHTASRFMHFFNPRAATLSILARVCFLLGHPAQAMVRSEEALAAANRLEHPPTAAFVLVHRCFFLQLMGERPLLRTAAETLVRVATEQGFATFLAYGTIFRGWALADGGVPDREAVRRIREGLDSLRSTGHRLDLPYALGLMSCAQGDGDVVERRRLLDEALRGVRDTGERWFEAELHRLYGELLLAPAGSDRARAEACFSRAIAVAREQNARMLELRGVVSLARLQAEQCRRREGHDLLARAYGWFTEGFDTPDLREAKTLLDELR